MKNALVIRNYIFIFINLKIVVEINKQYRRSNSFK